MAEIPNKITDIIDNYVDALRDNKIPIEMMFLFGSYAKGSYTQWSDIDLALVSNIFEGKRIKDKNKIRRLTLSISCDIEVFPYNPKNFVADDPFVEEILDTGIRIV